MIIQPLENPAQAVYCLNIVVKLPFRFTVQFTDVNHWVGTCVIQHLSTQTIGQIKLKYYIY